MWLWKSVAALLPDLSLSYKSHVAPATPIFEETASAQHNQFIAGDPARDRDTVGCNRTCCDGRAHGLVLAVDDIDIATLAIGQYGALGEDGGLRRAALDTSGRKTAGAQFRGI